MKAILNDDGEIENQETAAEMNARIIALSQVYFCIISTYFSLGSETPELLNLYYFCIYANSSNSVYQDKPKSKNKRRQGKRNLSRKEVI